MKFKPDRHHHLAISHLMDHNRAGLFMGLGLGKTVCALTAFSNLQTLGLVRATLVVAPLRVANLTWSNEAEKWDHLSDLRVANLRTRAGQRALQECAADVYTINYEMLPWLCEHYLSKVDKWAFDHIIFDELTMAKNPKSKRVNTLREYLPRILYRWGLTGTPTPNSLLELFAQIRLLDDGARLGPSFDRFKRTYFYPTDYMEYNWEPFDGAKEKIYSRISDICLTLRREEYGDTPEPVVEDVPVHLPPDAAKQYHQLEKEMMLMLEDSDIVAQNAAALVGKMVQFTGGASYKTVDGQPSREWVELHSAKLDALKHLASNRSHLPMLVACNYRHEQERILKLLPQAKLWPKADREQKQFLAEWSAKKIPIVVADPRSIGHGLNLQHGGHHVVWYSLPWSRELYDQFNARLVRRGQTEVTRIYRLICAGTVDDAIAETLRDRGDEQQALLQTLTNYRKMLSL